MSKTDYAENKVLDHLNGKSSFTMPTVYVALFTAAPSDAGGGTEVSGGSYARVATSGATWAAASGGAASNAAAISFPTASASWGTVTHYATFDAASSEERIAYYRKPFMVLWAAIQEASSELQDDYTLSPELSQLWVGEQIRQVSDSLVDRLAEIAVAHGESKSNVARAANASPDNVIRRFPRLKADAAHDRTLIDDVLDSLE